MLKTTKRNGRVSVSGTATVEADVIVRYVMCAIERDEIKEDKELLERILREICTYLGMQDIADSETVIKEIQKRSINSGEI